MTSIPTTHGSRIDRLAPNSCYDVARESCGTCRFWLPDQPVKVPENAVLDASDCAFGYCRRRPPVVIEALVRLSVAPPRWGSQTDADDGFPAIALYDSSTFPGSYATEWCGEYDRLQAGVAA